MSIKLIERSDQFGAGVAYATGHSGHLLNVPAGRMSAFQDQDDDFLGWLSSQPACRLHGVTPTAKAFVPRALYGFYLRDRLLGAPCETRPARLSLLHDRVDAIDDHSGKLTLRLASGQDCE